MKQGRISQTFFLEKKVNFKSFFILAKKNKTKIFLTKQIAIFIDNTI